MREFLRGLPVFAGRLADFDTAVVPENPRELFTWWLQDAVDAGVAEPHAMTLSTQGPDGPDARVLILKEVDHEGWWFATSAASVKGLQLAEQPRAALTFYWPGVGRQVRLRGAVVAGTPEGNAAAFRARSATARAVALVSHESQPLDDRETCLRAVLDSEAKLQASPTLVAPSWTVYVLAPSSVEFWQADKDRMHRRLRYDIAGDGTWTRTLLWP